MFGLGPTELAIIAVVVLLIFGAKRLPEIGKGIGGAVREFKKIKEEIRSEKPSESEKELKDGISEKTGAPSLESRLGEKVLEKMPGVKKAVDVKKKAEKVSRFFD